VRQHVDRYTCDFCGFVEDNPKSKTWRFYSVEWNDVGVNGYLTNKFYVCPKCTDSQVDQTTKGFLQRLLWRRRN
jgi:ribosomal protein S27AE